MSLLPSCLLPTRMITGGILEGPLEGNVLGYTFESILGGYFEGYFEKNQYLKSISERNLIVWFCPSVSHCPPYHGRAWPTHIGAQTNLHVFTTGILIIIMQHGKRGTARTVESRMSLTLSVYYYQVTLKECAGIALTGDTPFAHRYRSRALNEAGGGHMDSTLSASAAENWKWIWI